MDFSYTDEQKTLRKTVREFAEAEIRPHVSTAAPAWVTWNMHW